MKHYTAPISPSAISLKGPAIFRGRALDVARKRMKPLHRQDNKVDHAFKLLR
jgi:hypothetical protein